MTFGRDGERPRGEAFLEWLSDDVRQTEADGVGAFARWAVSAVDDGEVTAKDLWYPKRLEEKCRQFGYEDWKDAVTMYKSNDLRYRSSGKNDDTTKGRRPCSAEKAVTTGGKK